MRRLRNRSLDNTGFDNSTGNASGRLINRDGSSNIIRTGISRFDMYSAYHTFINLSFSHFAFFSLLAFFVANLFFATCYFLLGPEALGIPAKSNWFLFSESFFFSVQTITTVGYGHYYPICLMANILAAIEALFGCMSLAVLTGLLYGRFSRPRAYMLFSKHALVGPFKEGRALMFRLAPYKNTIITDAEVKLNLAITEEHEGKRVSKFYSLDVDVNKINTLGLNWTIVHPLNEESPLANLTEENIHEAEFEILVFFQAFDEDFSNTIKTKYSYNQNEIIFNAKFNQMFKRSEDQRNTILELDKIDDYHLL
ncbi:MAG: Ion transport 2 domain protein [Chitinophagaceae bacterium]|nr:Ion transport 2 domain protein [Chitinophagaceae bacterium]